MYKVKILDCTLRDGGRIINCEFSDRKIADITKGLSSANIDIIEVGFLRDKKIINYKGNSTFFTTIGQAESVIKDSLNSSEYVLFVDFGMFDFQTLDDYVPSQKISGLRVGFTKKNFNQNLDELIECFNVVKAKGYKLYIQGVNSIGYTDRQLLEIIEFVNEVHPHCFGIVDTYGAMYLDNLKNIYTLIDKNLDSDICIDFHSHNNFQMSFALAQEIIRICNGERELVLDATLMGMGKCAGNLNTELITDYLYRLKQYNYDNDIIFDLIDENISEYKKKYFWGYSIPAMMAGIYKSHPNNIIYLTEKFEIDTKDVKYILNQIDETSRMTYDYDNLEQIFLEYNSSKINDDEAIRKIKNICGKKIILVLCPGNSLKKERSKIDDFILKRLPIIFTVNFVDSSYEDTYAFFGNQKRYKQFYKKLNPLKTIVTSNIRGSQEKELHLDYSKCIECGEKYFGNSTLLLLRTLFCRVDVDEIVVAGFDGYFRGKKNYFVEELENNRREEEFRELNQSILRMLQRLMKKYPRKKISFLTHSYYEQYLES